MKNTVLLLGTLFCALTVAAANPEKPAKGSKAATKQSQSQLARDVRGGAKIQTRTGSRITRTVDLSGRITDGPYQLVVINEEAIRRSGASSLGQVLNRYGLRN